MAKKIMIRLKGVDSLTVIHADEVKKDGPVLVLTKGGTIVGELKDSEVQAWWIASD